MLKQKYVVGFMFDIAMCDVAMIRKNKPAWQAGLLNGIGGKVEEGEDACAAMVREFNEEAGVITGEWHHFHSMQGKNNDGSLFEVECFYSRVPSLHIVKTMEAEKIGIYDVDSIITGLEATIGNIPWLLTLARDFGIGKYPPAHTSSKYGI